MTSESCAKNVVFYSDVNQKWEWYGPDIFYFAFPYSYASGAQKKLTAGKRSDFPFTNYNNKEQIAESNFI